MKTTVDAQGPVDVLVRPVAEIAAINGCPVVFWDKSLPVGTKLYTLNGLEAIAKDAERYRWLRDSPSNSEALQALLNGVPVVIGEFNEFDAALDAAMGRAPNDESNRTPRGADGGNLKAGVRRSG